ncbi:MAG: CPBP family intramembrane metalloprotease [Treponema sp.]|nr:CPBP family intramembrane metalloprotease [Treponema sp.]
MRVLNKTGKFLILTFVISYSLAIAYGLVWGFTVNNRIGYTILGTIYMFVPFVSAMLVNKISRERALSNLRISFKINRWFFIAWLIFPVITFCSIGVSILLPGIRFDPELTGLFSRVNGSLPPEVIEQFRKNLQALPVNFIWISLAQGLIAGITVNAVAAFGEETGWRGFLLRQFRGMHFLKASPLIGFIWGIWHAPLILMGHNYPQHPRIGVLMMIAFCILLTPIIIYLSIKAKSVIAAAIAHGTMNAIAGISIMAVSGGNDLTTGITGAAGFITLVIFNAGIFAYDRFISREKIMSGKISDYL